MIIFLLILLSSILTDYLAIDRYNGLKGIRKVIHLGIAYTLAIYALFMFVGNHDREWYYIFLCLPFACSLWWTVKDVALGLALHHDPFYYGTGKWDSFFKRVPSKLLLFSKVFLTVLLWSLIKCYII